MGTLEQLGLLKMDFLGLRNLTVINDTLINIYENTGVKLSINDIDYEDQEVYKLFLNSDTDGVFQFESFGMRQFMKSLKPNCFEDLILGIAVFRPGPMEQIPKLIKNKENSNLITYLVPQLEEILDDTYGCMVYQEQVMQIFRALANYSMGRADLVRRAMSKKKMDVLKKEEELFVQGCRSNGIPAAKSKAIFKEILEFANYAFNKSHAASYAYLAYQTAYLKTYYPKEFMAALMSSYIDSQNKIQQYISLLDKMDIKIQPPDINLSLDKFYAKDNEIIFGLSAIKNVGRGLVRNIISEREKNGKFTDFNDFVSRMPSGDLNKKAVESLVKVGAFDSLSDRIDLLRIYELTLSSENQSRRNNIEGQLDLFSTAKEQKKPPKTILKRKQKLTKELLEMEKEVLGFYLSGHVLNEYSDRIKKAASAYSSEILLGDEENGDFDNKFNDGDKVRLVGLITKKRLKTNKRNQQFAIFTLEDLKGSIEIIVYYKQFEKYNLIIAEDNLVVIDGSVSFREGENPNIILEKIEIFNPDKFISKIYLRINEKNIKNFQDVKIFLKEHNGDTPIYVYFEEEKRNTLADKSMWILPIDKNLQYLSDQLGNENIKIV